MRLYNKAVIAVVILFLIPFYNYSFGNDNNLHDYWNDNKCATFIPNERKAQITKQDIIQFGKRPVCQKEYNSPQGNFTIHFDLTGLHKVPPEDKNSNGIPDFVDSVAFYFEYALAFFKDSLKMLNPLPESQAGGEYYNYDVYLQNIGDPYGYYGYTETDNELLPRRKFARYNSYIVIDNDFSPTDTIRVNVNKPIPTFAETGIMGMKITAAHELFHAVQNKYGIPLPSAAVLAEMTSSWFEYRLHPETKDYHQFVKSLFRDFSKYPFGVPDYITGYRYSIFCQYIYKTYGDRPFVRLWELIYDGLYGYRALDSALAEFGGGLKKDWKAFIPWLYHTGSRTVGKDYFDSASEFPEVSFNYSFRYSPPEILHNDKLASFELRPIRLRLPADTYSSDDTLDVFYSNIDFIPISGDVWDDPLPLNYSISCSKESYEECLPIPRTEYCVDMLHDTNRITALQYIHYGYKSFEIDFAFPNPFNRSKDKTLKIPVPFNARVYDNVSLVIYNSEMNEVYSGSHQVMIDGGSAGVKNRVIIWDSLPSELSSGVYIFEVEFKDKRKIGKFAVIR